MENVLFPSCVMSEKGILWLNVPCVKRKSVLLRRLGKWLVGKTRAARGQSSQSGSISVVERLSDLC
jgi:hypothetical protein